VLDLPIDYRRDRRPLRRPAAFPFDADGGVQPGRGIGASARRYRLTGTTARYVDPLAAGTGASPASPRATMWQELNAVTGPTTIYVRERPGVVMDLSNGPAGSACVDHCEIVAVKDLTTLEPGSVRIRMSAPLVWSSAGGGAYQATMDGNYVFAPYAVIDEKTLDVYGGGQWLTPVANLAAVQAAPGSWAKVGSTIYVRTSDSRAPDGDVAVMKDVNAIATVFKTALYLEGLQLDGGAMGVYAPQATQVTAHRCSMRHARLFGVAALNSDRVNLLEVTATGNGSDGITYTDVTQAIEVGVLSARNGNPITPANNCNGSTGHGESAIIRADGFYLDNQGPNLVDVLGAQSWNIRCRASGSIATQLSQRVGVWAGQGSSIWLDGCDVTSNPELDLKAADADSVISTYGTRYSTVGGLGAVRASRG
jgi:hypothetical protein